MTAPVAPKVAITKLEAARRQLRVAISSWFQDGDEVSIHTLACAAHEIINDINKHRGGKDLLVDSSVFREEYRTQVIKRFKKEMNFFKHADRDPEGVIDFVPKVTEMFTINSLHGIELFGLKHDSTEAAFSIWFDLKNPQFLTEKGRRQFVEGLTSEQKKEFADMSPRQFFELYKLARERFSHVR